VLPAVARRGVGRRLADRDAEARQGRFGFLEGERGLHPGLGRDAADAEASAAELALALDAGGLGAQLCRPDRGGVATRAASEDGYVNFHAPILAVGLKSVPGR